MKKDTSLIESTTRQQRYALTMSASCQCKHYHAQACYCLQHRISLLNAHLMREKCYCLCHYTRDSQQINEQAWLRAHRQEVSA